MGEKVIRIRSDEVGGIVVYCPKCGVGIQLALRKDLHSQAGSFASCVCGAPFPEALREVVGDLCTATQVLEEGNYRLDFEMDVE